MGRVVLLPVDDRETGSNPRSLQLPLTERRKTKSNRNAGIDPPIGCDLELLCSEADAPLQRRMDRPVAIQFPVIGVNKQYPIYGLFESGVGRADFVAEARGPMQVRRRLWIH